MIIRFFAYFYPPCIGGGEVILANQARVLAARGHEVHVHCTNYSNIALTTTVDVGDTVEQGVHVHRYSSVVLPFSNPLEKDAVTPGFVSAMAKPADLLVAVGYPSIHFDLLLAKSKLQGIPLVVQNYVTAGFLDELLSSNGGINKRIRSAYWKKVVRRELASADIVLADSPSAAKALSERLAIDNVVCHIGMAVDPGEFDKITKSDIAEARGALGLKYEKIILAPSRISVQKGADILIEAAGALLSDDIKLVIVGPVNDEDFYSKVRNLAEPFGDKIIFGKLPRNQLLALMKSAAVVTLPSRGETVGGVVFEGMYAGAIVVVSNAVEAARDDYLHHEKNGLMFESENILELRSALSRGLFDQLNDIREAGREMVASRFTWETSVDRLLNLYHQAMER